jgi:hypothetical protein
VSPELAPDRLAPPAGTLPVVRLISLSPRLTWVDAPPPRLLAACGGRPGAFNTTVNWGPDMLTGFVRRRGHRPAAALVALILLGALAPACRPRGQAALPYTQRIQALRDAKDRFFAAGAETPIPAGRQQQFLPLAYFAIDESYNVAATLAPSDREPAMEMPTSTGQRRQMRRAGTLKFALKGQPLQLTAFVEADSADMNRLFVPFGDMTNGTETYAPGRYLDLERSPTGFYEVDFNKAYHPYCYYNETYDCPYPPSENRLPLPVRAGERIRKAS